jgi:hypothetical protein
MIFDFVLVEAHGGAKTSVEGTHAHGEALCCTLIMFCACWRGLNKGRCHLLQC